MLDPYFIIDDRHGENLLFFPQLKIITVHNGRTPNNLSQEEINRISKIYRNYGSCQVLYESIYGLKKMQEIILNKAVSVGFERKS